METIAIIVFIVFEVLNILCFIFENLSQLMEQDYAKRRYK